MDKYWLIQKLTDRDYKSLSTKQVKDFQFEYDVYNAEVDPAHGLFKSYFGTQWADDFVHQFLFPKSFRGCK